MLEIVKKDANNNFIMGSEPKLVKSTIKFKGKNNRLVCEDNVVLYDSNIYFEGDNSIIYLSRNNHRYHVHVSIFNNSFLFFDERTYLASKVSFVISEGRNVFIGENCMFAKRIALRLSDAHLIYDVESMERINVSESVYMGDHVWIGQEALLLKGIQIGSGSIIGARCVLSSKKIPSNSLWGGIPAREIRKNVFYDSASNHFFTDIETSKSMKYDSDRWIYQNEGEVLSFDDIELKIRNAKDVDEKVNLLIQIRNNKSHNRFYIPDE